MKTTIYVMAHKKFYTADSLPDGWIPMQVGRAESSEDLGYLCDDTGDNISDLNHLFGELTGIYWVWKNDMDSDIIGVCHYRRFFTDVQGRLLEGKDFEDILSDGGVLISQCIPCEQTYRDNYSRVHHKRDMEALEYGVRTAYPDYMPEFEKAMNGHKQYFGNIFVMKRDDYMSYCQWLFDVLMTAGEKVDITGYDAYHARIYGFLSEILVYVWALHNKKNIHEGHLMMTGYKAETLELIDALSLLIKNRKISEAKQLYEEVTRIRPDVLFKASDIRGKLADIWKVILACEKEKNEGREDLLNRSTDINELISIVKKL